MTFLYIHTYVHIHIFDDGYQRITQKKKICSLLIPVECIDMLHVQTLYVVICVCIYLQYVYMYEYSHTSVIYVYMFIYI